MYNSTRVRVAQCFGDVAHDPHSVLHRELARSLESLAHVFALDKGHRVVEQRPFRGGRKKRHDVRMTESRCKLNLAAEPLGVHSRGNAGRKNLDDYLPLELRFGSDEHAGHARAAQLLLYMVCGSDGFLELVLQVGCQARAPLLRRGQVRIAMCSATSGATAP